MADPYSVDLQQQHPQQQSSPHIGMQPPQQQMFPQHYQAPVDMSTMTPEQQHAYNQRLLQQEQQRKMLMMMVLMKQQQDQAVNRSANQQLTNARAETDQQKRSERGCMLL